LKRSQTGFVRINQTNNPVSNKVNAITETTTTTKNDPLFEQKLELATEGLEPHFLRHMRTKVSSDNALTISNYILSMTVAASYRRTIISTLKLLSEFLSNKLFTDMSSSCAGRLQEGLTVPV
jgi:hypothetical protein